MRASRLRRSKPLMASTLAPSICVAFVPGSTAITGNHLVPGLQDRRTIVRDPITISGRPPRPQQMAPSSSTLSSGGSATLRSNSFVTDLRILTFSANLDSRAITRFDAVFLTHVSVGGQQQWACGLFALCLLRCRSKSRRDIGSISWLRARSRYSSHLASPVTCLRY